VDLTLALKRLETIERTNVASRGEPSSRSSPGSRSCPWARGPFDQGGGRRALHAQGPEGSGARHSRPREGGTAGARAPGPRGKCRTRLALVGSGTPILTFADKAGAVRMRLRLDDDGARASSSSRPPTRSATARARADKSGGLTINDGDGQLRCSVGVDAKGTPPRAAPPGREVARVPRLHRGRRHDLEPRRERRGFARLGHEPCERSGAGRAVGQRRDGAARP